MGRDCSVCVHKDRVKVDSMIVAGKETCAKIAKSIGVSESAIQRHRARHVVGSDKGALAIHRAIGAAIEHGTHASAVARDMTRLYETTMRDWESARERSDWSLAIKVVRELTRMHELQARLVLESRSARASDVANHPIFHDVLGSILSALAPYPEAMRAVQRAVDMRLGIVTADVHPVTVEGEPG
jgi:hypothetical protein